jgi:hypothetical protein
MPAPNPWDYAEKSGKEHAHQAALFMWANMACRFGAYAAGMKSSYIEPGAAIETSKHAFATGNDHPIPQLKWFHAIHNQGHGDVVHGAKAKAEGVKAGVFDMFLPVPMVHAETTYYGLYIELKVGKNIASNDQLEFQSDMNAAGYATAIAWGWEEAREYLLKYLGLPYR